MPKNDKRQTASGRKSQSSGTILDRAWRISLCLIRLPAIIMEAMAISIVGSPVLAQSVPSDPDGFTAYIAGQFRAAMPKADIHVEAPLHLIVKSVTRTDDAYLDTVFSACLRNTDRCDSFVGIYISQMATLYETPASSLDRTKLRVVVRPTAYVDEIRQTLASSAKPVAAPLQSGFWLIGVSDQPTTIEMVNSRNLARLGLSIDQGLAIGKQNMVTEMRRHIDGVLAGDHRSIVLMTGDPYESSLFAFPELWSPLAKALGGNLLIVVPASDVVLCGDGALPNMATQLADAAETVIANANRPFFPTVFRWTPAGWVPFGHPASEGK